MPVICWVLMCFLVDEILQMTDYPPFPADRLSQGYQQFIIDLQTKLNKLPPGRSSDDLLYCKTALSYLRVSKNVRGDIMGSFT